MTYIVKDCITDSAIKFFTPFDPAKVADKPADKILAEMYIRTAKFYFVISDSSVVLEWARGALDGAKHIMIDEHLCEKLFKRGIADGIGKK